MDLATIGSLTLNRKIGESIMIGDNITVKVMNIDHRTVSLSVMAPRVIPVLREELLAKQKTERDHTKGVLLAV